MTRTLDPIPYWQLRAKCADAQRATIAALAARDAAIAAEKAQAVALVAVGLDPKLPTFTLDDDTCSITIPD